MKRKISFEDIPVNIIEEYGRQDVISTRALFDAQMADFKKEGNKSLLKSAKMMNEFLPVLADMEINGIHIDLDALINVEVEFKEEFGRLAQQIKKIIEESNLSNSEFAEKIGIPKSSVTHLLSERNKPSLDLITKISENFDEITLDYLIFGVSELKKDKAID